MNKWQSIVNELRQFGMTQQEIADSVPCSQNYISDISRGVCGKRPSHDIAAGLLKLHRTVFKKAKATA